MAVKQNSKRNSRKSLKGIKDAPMWRGAFPIITGAQDPQPTDPDKLTRAQLADIGRRYIEWRNAHEQATAERQPTEAERRAAEYEAKRERIEREGVTLKGRRRDHAISIVNAVNMSALSVHDLAVSANSTMDIHEAASYLGAIQECAILICRRADALTDYLGDSPAFGNFKDDLRALSQDEADRMDREQAVE